MTALIICAESVIEMRSKLQKSSASTFTVQLMPVLREQIRAMFVLAACFLRPQGHAVGVSS